MNAFFHARKSIPEPAGAVRTPVFQPPRQPRRAEPEEEPEEDDSKYEWVPPENRHLMPKLEFEYGQDWLNPVNLTNMPFGAHRYHRTAMVATPVAPRPRFEREDVNITNLVHRFTSRSGDISESGEKLVCIWRSARIRTRPPAPMAPPGAAASARRRPFGSV